MPEINAHEVGGTNVVAFLDMLAWSEGTDNGRQRTQDRGYGMLVGGGVFSGYDQHPNVLVPLPKLKSNRLQLVGTSSSSAHGTSCGRGSRCEGSSSFSQACCYPASSFGAAVQARNSIVQLSSATDTTLISKFELLPASNPPAFPPTLTRA